MEYFGAAVRGRWRLGTDILQTAGDVVPATRWIEQHCWNPETVNRDNWDYRYAERIKLEVYQRRILNKVLTLNEKGKFPYSEIVWSQIKKSGKTGMAAFVGAWFADQIEPPNLVLCVANDKEQAAGRIFSSMGPTVHQLAGKFPNDTGSSPIVRLKNGTIIRALPNDYAGEAGANYGLTLWSELWGFTSKRADRLFAELLPVPTRRNSIRWIETYAGFEDESKLLLNLFLKIFTDTSERELQPGARRVPGLEDMPCFERPELGLFMFWDHERRMPWQQGESGDQYYAQMKAKLSTTDWLRLGENRWQKSEGTFIPEDWLIRSVQKDAGADFSEPMVLCADGSVSGDNTALVGVRKIGDRYKTCYAKIWEIESGTKIDLEETLCAEIRSLHMKGLIQPPVWYDPYQLHQPMLNLSKEGIATEEFVQGDERLRADTFLYQMYRDGLIDNYNEPTLLDNIRSAKSKEEPTTQRIRIVKGSAVGHIKNDGCVAQSMAVYKASQPQDEPITAAGRGGRVMGEAENFEVFDMFSRLQLQEKVREITSG